MPLTPSSRTSLRAPLAALAVGLGWLFLADLGFAGGSIEEQRARLPPPAECTDPVEGVWVGHNFEARWQQWYIFTLEVKREDKEKPDLKGTIRAHYWDGNDKDVNPPPCRPGMRQQKVVMPAKGDVKEGKIAFGGLSWTTEASICGSWASYNPDKFTGQIDPKTQEFQSVNNDGGRAVNVPTVFRRVRCFDDPQGPEPGGVTVKPPPFMPPRKSGGCGR